MLMVTHVQLSFVVILQDIEISRIWDVPMGRIDVLSLLGLRPLRGPPPFSSSIFPYAPGRFFSQI